MEKLTYKQLGKLKPFDAILVVDRLFGLAMECEFLYNYGEYDDFPAFFCREKGRGEPKKYKLDEFLQVYKNYTKKDADALRKRFSEKKSGVNSYMLLEPNEIPNAIKVLDMRSSMDSSFTTCPYYADREYIKGAIFALKDHYCDVWFNEHGKNGYIRYQKEKNEYSYHRYYVKMWQSPNKYIYHISGYDFYIAGGDVMSITDNYSTEFKSNELYDILEAKGFKEIELSCVSDIESDIANFKEHLYKRLG